MVGKIPSMFAARLTEPQGFETRWSAKIFVDSGPRAMNRYKTFPGKTIGFISFQESPPGGSNNLEALDAAKTVPKLLDLGA